MTKFRLIVVLILAVLGVVLVMQNTESVETRLFLWTVSMPRAVLLFITAFLGFGVGILVMMLYKKNA